MKVFNEQINIFIDGKSNIGDLHYELCLHYPELEENSKLPDAVLRDVIVDEEMDEGIVEHPKPQHEKKKPKDLQLIEKRLRERLKVHPWQDFTDLTGVFRLGNEQYCLKTLKHPDKAESDARKRIVYFSVLKGEVLKRLKDITGKKMRTFLEMTNYKQSHAYFLIQLFDLTQEYNKLMYSDVPRSFFKSNMKEIKSICQKDEISFI